MNSDPSWLLMMIWRHEGTSILQEKPQCVVICGARTTANQAYLREAYLPPTQQTRASLLEEIEWRSRAVLCWPPSPCPDGLSWLNPNLQALSYRNCERVQHNLLFIAACFATGFALDRFRPSQDMEYNGACMEWVVDVSLMLGTLPKVYLTRT